MRWLNLRILSLYSRVGVGLTFTESSGEGQSESARQWAFRFRRSVSKSGVRSRPMPKRESVRWDRLSPVFASAFNGSVSVEGSRNGPDVRSVREGEVLCRFRKDLRLACDAGDLRARERSYSDEWERTDVRLMSDLPESSERTKKQDLEIALLRGPVFQCRSRGRLAVL